MCFVSGVIVVRSDEWWWIFGGVGSVVVGFCWGGDQLVGGVGSGVLGLWWGWARGLSRWRVSVGDKGFFGVCG